MLNQLASAYQGAPQLCGPDNVCGVDDAIGWFGVLSLAALLWAVFYFLWKRIHQPSLIVDVPRDGNNAFSALIEQIAKLDERIDQLLAEVEELKKQRDELKKQAQDYAALRKELEERAVIAPLPPPPRPMHVLGIWPTVPGQPALDQQGEADALYNAGYAYTALRGVRANRAGVVLEIDRVKPTIIQVGGHGTNEGVMLSDGPADAGWWGELLQGKGIDLVVLMSCESSQQDMVNIADALIRVGVKAVVSCDDKVEDGAAVRFSQVLYAGLAENYSLIRAFARAKLALSRGNAEMIRLRESV